MKEYELDLYIFKESNLGTISELRESYVMLIIDIRTLVLVTDVTVIICYAFVEYPVTARIYTVKTAVLL